MHGATIKIYCTVHVATAYRGIFNLPVQLTSKYVTFRTITPNISNICPGNPRNRLNVTLLKTGVEKTS
jgi:hypothetical protein